MKQLVIVLLFLFSMGGLMQANAQQGDAFHKPWHVLGFFDCENDELERICEYNINQLEEIDSSYAKVVAIFDRPYKKAIDSSVRIYDIKQDQDRARIISNSISIGEKDMGTADVLDEFLSKYLGPRNILIIKAHGYGILSPPPLRPGYNSPQDPFVISRVLRERITSPIEVMIFDSCNMASIEVAYEFRDLVSVMVASQDLMYYSLDILGKPVHASRPGIDYIDLVLKLRPNSDPITVGSNVVSGFTEIVNKKDALFYKATMSALDLTQLDISIFKIIADTLMAGIQSSDTHHQYMAALLKTLESASFFHPLGRNGILTHYDVSDFLDHLEQNLGVRFQRPKSAVIQSYSNNFVNRATGLSVLFFKNLTGVPDTRRAELFNKYNRSGFAKATGWGRLMKLYHDHLENRFVAGGPVEHLRY
ncbi:MAG TPA: hypothetical protein DHV36_07415 [Desulfobacteraceae bacterium]|nr:hypothetical protein [Desulfobacteraceae bacterium]